MARSNCRQRFRMSVSVPKRRPSIFGEWYTCINKEGKVRNHLKLLENLKRFIRGRNHDEPMAYYSSIETCNSDATSFFSPIKRGPLYNSAICCQNSDAALRDPQRQQINQSRFSRLKTVMRCSVWKNSYANLIYLDFSIVLYRLTCLNLFCPSVMLSSHSQQKLHIIRGQ